ncbi:MAG: lytic transglycosylase domain-containing protein [Pseudomonadales bacterium]|nr:lytic transglycosylase domain-containing protein [Pseudomonadales bacterium]
MRRYAAGIGSLLIWLTVQVHAWDVIDAHEAYKHGHFAELGRMAQAKNHDLLESYVQYWWLLSQLTTTTPDAVDIFLQEHSGTLVAEHLRAAWVRELARRQDWNRLLDQFKLLVGPSDDSLGFAWRAYWALHNLDALQAAQDRWMAPRPLPDSCLPMFQGMVTAGLIPEENVWKRVRIDFDLRDTEDARLWLTTLDHPLNGKDLQLAHQNPGLLLKNVDLSHRQQRELSLYALDQLARHDLNQAQDALTTLSDRLPSGAQAHAWQQLALQAALQHDPRALAWFARAEPLTPLARSWEIRAALRSGDWHNVAVAIHALPTADQQKPAWQYWLGRSELQTGHPQQGHHRLAQLALNDDYYGLLARDELGPMLLSAHDYVPDKTMLAQINQLAGIRRALALRDAGLRAEAVQEWDWNMRSLSDQELLAAAEVANRAGWFDRAIYSAEQARTLNNISLRYLTPYRDVLEGYAHDLNLDPAWVYGLIRQESRFTVVAHSGVGASGLMQLMPDTAQWVANRLGIRYHSTAVNEVGTNVRLGTYYLRHILDALNGNPILATAAYNAGPRRARAWQDSRPMEAAVYVETIPFSETRDYVKKVMTNAEHYALAFESGHSMVLHLGTIPAHTDLPLIGP